MPERILPMLAGAGGLPADEAGWSFEVKWDGVRAIAYAQPGRLRLESRNLHDITDGYPELRGLMRVTSACARPCSTGRSSPSMTPGNRASSACSGVCMSPRRRRSPAGGLDPGGLRDLRPALSRRPALMEPPLRRAARGARGAGRRARPGGCPPPIPAPGASCSTATRAQGLEGIVAKRLDSRYEPGRRTGAWIKIKHTPPPGAGDRRLAARRGPPARAASARC